MGASDEDESLRDNGNLEVDDSMQLLVIVVDLVRGRIQVDMELPLEEVRFEDHNNKNDPAQAIRTQPRMKIVRGTYVESVR